MNIQKKMMPWSRRLFWPFIGIAAISSVFILYWLCMSLVIPAWQDRALFGDAFGAMNAFASAVALIAVAYTLYLQQRQIEEMQRTVQLQQQPVLVIKDGEIVIDPPDVFTSPEDPAAEAMSRYRCNVAVSNASDEPAVNAVVSVALTCGQGENREVISSLGKHYAVIAPHEKEVVSVMLHPKEPYTRLFEVLRTKDAFSLPCISVTLVYKNLLGASFQIQRVFQVDSQEVDEVRLRSWHEAISSFHARYQAELTSLAKAYEKAGVFDRATFTDIKDRFGATVTDRECLRAPMCPMPGSFTVDTITGDAYNGYVKAVGFGRKTFEWTECPVKRHRAK